MLAASKGNAAVVKYLVRIGADVTLKGEDGMTALHMAAKSGHLDVCKIILTECKVPRTLVGNVCCAELISKYKQFVLLQF